MTPRELAIARTVIYSSLFDYPLTLAELHRSLVESDQTPGEILAVYEGSEMLQEIVEFRDGFFFPAGRGGLVGERARRQARSAAFLRRHARMLRIVCAIPFTRLVALSGSIAHSNLEPGGDLDLFIVARGASVWTVTVALLAAAKLLGRRRTICANFLISDAHLRLEDRDVFTANQVIHLRPILGADVWKAMVDANAFVASFYPNAICACERAPVDPPGRVAGAVKRGLEIGLAPALPLVEALCRRMYASHLRRKARTWQSPEQVSLAADYLKLHTKSHRRSVLERFEAAVDEACSRAMRELAPRALAGGRR
jgi:hypothetical protein